MKHTAGPWRVDNNHGALWVESDCETLTARIAKGIGKEQDKANARLIAAAPELLEALQDLLDSVPPTWECAERARDIINKATGETA